MHWTVEEHEWTVDEIGIGFTATDGYIYINMIYKIISQ